MNRKRKVSILLTLFTTIGVSATEIKTFSDLKSKFLSGVTINAVINVGQCKPMGDALMAPDCYSSGAYKNLHASFVSGGGYHTIEESTSIEAILFLNSQRVLIYNQANTTTPFSPSGLISELIIRQNDEVYLIYGVSKEGKPEDTCVLSCNWNDLLLNSAE